MKKKQSILEKACENVPGFDFQLKRLRRSKTISGTLHNFPGWV
ncbi:hypothetical protein [Cyclobacterium sediminis]